MVHRLHPQARAAAQRTADLAATLPPLRLAAPMDPSRIVNDTLAMIWTEGGPQMAHSQDRFIFAHGRRILCRLHIARNGPPPAVLVWFHGGGWVWSSIDTHDRLAREYAAAGDVAVINVDYSLSPESKFPHALLECAEVVRHLARNGADWGIDPSRILVGGDSAGGNLALATALALRDTGGPALRGILTPYPVTDADFETPSYREFAEGYGLTRAAMMTYWDMYAPGAADRLNPLAAPLRGVLAGLPPTLIQIAELDVLHEDGKRMADRLQAAGVDVTFEICKGVPHGFMRLSGAVDEAAHAIARAGVWLKRVTA